MLYLVELGYCVWVFNLCGYGKLLIFEGKDVYMIDNLFEDVGGFIDYVMVEFVIEEVVMLVYDWGVFIVWEFVMCCICFFDCLVIMNVFYLVVVI